MLGDRVAQDFGSHCRRSGSYGVLSGSPLYSRKVTGLCADGWGANSIIGLNAGGAFVAEIVLTFLFVLVVLAATSHAASAGFAGLAIGMALTVVHLIGIPLTGTSVNPVRSLAPACIVGGDALSQVWLFIVAPLVGGSSRRVRVAADRQRPAEEPPRARCSRLISPPRTAPSRAMWMAVGTQGPVMGPYASRAEILAGHLALAGLDRLGEPLRDGDRGRARLAAGRLAVQRPPRGRSRCAVDGRRSR